LTVALLGVLISMVAGRAVNEPDPHQQKITLKAVRSAHAE